MPYDYKTPSSVSLDNITAGTLNPSLKMAAGNTATSAANEIFSPAGGGLELNVPAGKTVLLARDATAWSEIGFILPTIGNYRTYFSPNTTGAGSNDNGLLLCGGRPDPSTGVSVGTFGYCELFGYDANQIVAGTSQQSYGSVCIGTASSGASVAQARIWFYGHLNTVGGHYYPCASIAQAGIEIFKTTQDYGVLLRADNVTADRTFDFPDASGTLMVSGGSGSVSISNLTAGTLPVSLTLTNSLTVTAASRQLIGTSGGVQINTPTGTTLISSVNGSTIETLSSTLDSMAVPIRWTTNVALTSTDYVIGKHSTTQLALNAASGGSVGMLIAGSEVGKFTSNGLDLSTNSKAIVFGSGGSAGSADRRMAGTSLGVDINAPTGAARIRLLANGNVQFATDVDTFWLGNGAYAGDNTKSFISGGGTGSLILSSPTGATYTRFYTGATFSGYIGNGLGGFGKPASSDATQAGISWASGGVVLDTGNGAGNRVLLQAAGTTQFAIQTDTFWLGAGAYASDTTKSYITGGGVGNLTCNAGTSSSVLLQVAGTTKYTFAATTLTLADAVDLIFNSTTGTKIGGSGAKLALYGAPPIVRPTTAVAAAAFVANSGTAVNDASTFGGYTLKQVVQALQNIGALT